MVVSSTARQTGFGSDQHKRVTGLTAYERETIRKGGRVAYDCGRLSGGTHGTRWRVAIEGTKRDFYPRVPSALELDELPAWSAEDVAGV